MASNSWLCLQTKSGNENALAKQLNSLSITAYAPLYQKTVASRYGVKTTYDLPLFRSYLFTSPDYYERKTAIQLLPVALRSRVIGEIDTDFISEMQAREQGGFVLLNQAESKVAGVRPYRRGDAVMITGGSAFGYEAIFESYTSDDQRVIILANMFNRPMPMPYAIGEIALAV